MFDVKHIQHLLSRYNLVILKSTFSYLACSTSQETLFKMLFHSLFVDVVVINVKPIVIIIVITLIYLTSKHCYHCIQYLENGPHAITCSNRVILKEHDD